MTKLEAVSIFGTTYKELAEALHISKSAVSQWPEELTERQTCWVIGAAMRQGKQIPKEHRRAAAA